MPTMKSVNVLAKQWHKKHWHQVDELPNSCPPDAISTNKADSLREIVKSIACKSVAIHHHLAIIYIEPVIWCSGCPVHHKRNGNWFILDTFSGHLSHIKENGSIVHSRKDERVSFWSYRRKWHFLHLLCAHLGHHRFDIQMSWMKSSNFMEIAQSKRDSWRNDGQPAAKNQQLNLFRFLSTCIGISTLGAIVFGYIYHFNGSKLPAM